ncbi:hypothetical protein TRAPUB_940 [Trametes pubescens]|nr:hypothetical protein TRAPUB_940 [Trametes pubescens]
MDYVPEYPVERKIIETYADGRWGVREYSRWPQMLVPDMMHVACIPTASSAEWDDVLWRALLPTTEWEEDVLTGVRDLGFIKKETRNALSQTAALVITRFEMDVEMRVDSPQDYREHGTVLVLILRQCVERMEKLPSPAGIAVAVAAHIQRISLELAGLCTYLEVVHQRLTDSTDHSSELLPVIGTFVREGTAAQTCRRVGLPTWFLQPLTNTLSVWRIVDFLSLPTDMSGRRCEPPIHHESGAVAGITNLTGSWLRTMALSVSKLVCATHMPALETGDGPAVVSAEDGPPEAKRPKVFDGEVHAKHLVMRPGAAAEPPGAEKKKNRRQRKRKLAEANTSNPPGEPSTSGGQPPPPSAGGAEQEHPPASAAIVQPAKTFVPSPFYLVPKQWAEALREASPVPRAAASSLYFYPPPFLLDTVSSQLPLPADVMNHGPARNDDKVLRYIHNLLRIRRFCRTRLFDPMMSSHPLTIMDWRAALWGDFGGKSKEASGSNPANLRRTKRRQDEWNAICRLFERVALLPSYRDDLAAPFRGGAFKAEDVATAQDVRLWVLWESHEINFRCELMALDTLLVHRKEWKDIHRWTRESAVSAVWGKPASVVSVLPAVELSGESDRWVSGDPERWTCDRDFIRAFVKLMIRWPDAPPEFVKADAAAHPWDEAEYATLSRVAVDFYVKTFVRIYRRLPVPPIPQPM